MSYKSKRSKATDISPKVKQKVYERDNKLCIVCYQLGIPDAHYIRRTQGGLGIEENVVTLCRTCHHEYDDGSKREEIGERIKQYLKSIYGDSWDEEKLKYSKWNGFKYSK
jgi:5-methylcytosine-specific restriction endonuclease McrA